MELLLLTADPAPSSVLPALALLRHRVHTAAPEIAALLDARPPDAVLVDARSNLLTARGLCRLLERTRPGLPVIAVVTEDELVAVSGEWRVDEILLSGAGATEVDARLRLLRSRSFTGSGRAGDALVLGELAIDEAAYSVRVRGRPLALAYKEFELLKHLAVHAGQVFSRAQLLREIWGYDFFGGPRTVDVHIRRLRAKLGTEHEQMIGTVRNVGYTFVRPDRDIEERTAAPGETDRHSDGEDKDERAADRMLGTVS